MLIFIDANNNVIATYDDNLRDKGDLSWHPNAIAIKRILDTVQVETGDIDPTIANPEYESSHALPSTIKSEFGTNYPTWATCTLQQALNSVDTTFGNLTQDQRDWLKKLTAVVIYLRNINEMDQ